MYLIWMTQEQEIQLPYLPSIENFEALSRFDQGRSRSDSMEELEVPRLRRLSHDGLPAFDDFERFDDIDDHHHQQQQQQQQQKLLSLPSATASDAASHDGASDSSHGETACISCQKRKSKCNHGQPCSVCLSLGQDCVYSLPKKRGPKPGSMMRIKEEAHHLKEAVRAVLQTLVSISPDFSDLDNSTSKLLSDAHVFDAASCQAVLKGLTVCLRRIQQRKKETSAPKAKGSATRA